MSRSPIPHCGKTACRMEVLGKVQSLSFDASTSSCLATTILNGAHVFHMGDAFYGPNLSTGMSASSVESYPYSTFGQDPLLCGCFVADGTAVSLGSASGSITTASRRSRGITSSFVLSNGAEAGNGDDDGEDAKDAFYLPIRSLSAMLGLPAGVLACTETTTAVVDVERSLALYRLVTPVPRGVAAVPLTASTIAVANYDGKVLVYDTRESLKPCVVLSVPDQITSLAQCHETQQVCVGTVAGRVFTLRCLESAMREQAFGTGKKRSPIRSVAIHHNKIVAGDLAGKLSILDASDGPNSTRYWTAEALLGEGERGDHCDGSAMHEGETSNLSSGQSASMSGQQTEVTAVTLAHGIAWAAFSSADSLNTQVVALPV